MSSELSALKAKLLAQKRLAEETKLKKEKCYKEAVKAVKTMVLLGESMENIIDRCNGLVSRQTIQNFFAELNFVEKIKSNEEKNMEVFGARRWIKHTSNFCIDMSSDEDLEEDKQVTQQHNTSTNLHATNLTSNAVHNTPPPPIKNTIELNGSTPQFSMNEQTFISMSSPPQPPEIPNNSLFLPTSSSYSNSAMSSEGTDLNSRPNTADIANLSIQNNIVENEEVDVEISPTEQVSNELARVRLQIQQMEQRKIDLENKKQASAEANRKGIELRNIAVKRALTKESRVQLLAKINEYTRNVTKYKHLLAESESNLSNCRQELINNDRTEKELSIREEQIRIEMSRPQITLPQAPETNENDDMEVETPEPPNMNFINIMTVADSPLRGFSSFRMCPNYGPSLWFSNSFNGRFIHDLPSRILCPEMLKHDLDICKDVECTHVHFTDFDVKAEDVLKYMATRNTNDRYLQELKNRIKTHLGSERASAAQIAAVIVGLKSSENPTNILDWGTWHFDSMSKTDKGVQKDMDLFI